MQKYESSRCKFWNVGYCKHKNECQFLHPEIICSEGNCLDKACKKRHPKLCKNWAKGSCKFQDLCQFTHDKNLYKNLQSEEYFDFDNFEAIDVEENKVDKKSIEYSCDKCDYKITSKAKLIIHENMNHKIVKLKNSKNEQKKTSTDAINKDKSEYVDYDNIDSDDDESVFSCDQCEYYSGKKSNLTKHVRNVHKKENDNQLKRKRENNTSISPSKKTKETCEQNLD